MTDLSLKLLTYILDSNRNGTRLGNGVLVASNRNGEYVAWKPNWWFVEQTIEITRPTIPELAARMEEMGWLK